MFDGGQRVNAAFNHIHIRRIPYIMYKFISILCHFQSVKKEMIYASLYPLNICAFDIIVNNFSDINLTLDVFFFLIIV